jgi:predicted ATP-grasp superfamily ATP-dependent carboligase
MNVLLVGGGLQGLSCGSSLFAQHSVSIITDELMCRKSRFFKKVYVNSLFETAIFDILSKNRFDVILPISDLTVPLVSKNKELIESHYGVKCAVPSYDLVSRVADKSSFMFFCRQNNIPHPKTSPITSGDSFEQLAKEIGFPALIKPNYSVGARGITRVDSLEELSSKYPEIYNNFGSCTLQELIDNQEYYYNVMLYRNSSGRILASVILKIVRMYPINAGSSACCVTVENETLIDICKDCLDKMDYVGMADFDVLQRRDNGEYKIIEINPRVPASIKGAYISGVNFPEVIIKDTIGDDVPVQSYHPGKIMRYLGLDFLWFLNSKNRLATKPSWFSFIGSNIFYQDIFINDVSTWWSWLAEGIMKIGNRNKKQR